MAATSKTAPVPRPFSYSSQPIPHVAYTAPMASPAPAPVFSLPSPSLLANELADMSSGSGSTKKLDFFDKENVKEDESQISQLQQDLRSSKVLVSHKEAQLRRAALIGKQLLEKEGLLKESLAAEKETASVLNHEISSLTYRNQQLQQRLEMIESESLSNAVKSAREDAQKGSAASPGGGFRRRGSWSPLPQSAQKGPKTTPVASSADLQVIERLREENERLQDEKQQLKEEATEARMENSQLLAKLEARTLEARTSVAEMTKASHAHRLHSSKHSQSIENLQGKLDALRQNLESEKNTVRYLTNDLDTSRIDLQRIERELTASIDREGRQRELNSQLQQELKSANLDLDRQVEEKLLLEEERATALLQAEAATALAVGHAGDIESLKQHVNDLEAECASNEFEEALGHEPDADGEEQVKVLERRLEVQHVVFTEQIKELEKRLEGDGSKESERVAVLRKAILDAAEHSDGEGKSPPPSDFDVTQRLQTCMHILKARIRLAEEKEMELRVTTDLNEAAIRRLKSELRQYKVPPPPSPRKTRNGIAIVEDDGDGRDCYMAFWDTAKCAGDQDVRTPMGPTSPGGSSFPGGVVIADANGRADEDEEDHDSSSAWLGLGGW